METTPKNHFKKYPFVDREGHIQTFKKAVNNIGQNEFNVLVYYGVAGIGKTSLRKELPKYLEEYNCEFQHKEVIWTSIDLQMDAHREKSTFLVTLKNDLQKKHKINFPSFEIAHAIYWKKAKPEIPLRKDNYLLFEGDDAFDDFFGVFDQIPYFSLVPAVGRLLKSFPDYIRKWWKKIGEEELLQLSEKEPLEIEEMLPYFWAQDLNNYLEDTSKSAVLFIDTYEALWENHRIDGHSRDEWIREDLIPYLPKKVLWVICGREALRWEEINSEWNDNLTQFEVEELLKAYCTEYLENQAITDKEIHEAIFKGSKGVPYYLELSVYIYENIMGSGKPKPEDIGDDHQKIADRFLRFLSPEEKNALNVLSVPHFWDYDLFEYLVKEFNTGYPTNDYEDLCSFSFIGKTENNKQQMHQLMQESLQKTQEKKKPDSVKRIHKAISEYYENKLENIDIKSITQEHENALTEAFYHAKKSLEAKYLYNWFIIVSDSFYKAAFWQLITPMYEEMLQILEAKLKSENPDVAVMLNNLALLYRHMGNYEKALQLSQRALDINEKVLDPQDPYVATTQDNLAGLYESMGDYEKAFSYYKRALDIRENVLGSQNPDVTKTQNNLAGLYESMGDYANALLYYKRAFKTVKKFLDPNLDPKHPYIATTLSNIAFFYSKIGYCEQALPLSQRALDINEKMLGPQHPYVATTLDKLAGIYSNIGDYKKALPLYKRALDIREKSLGPQHPYVAIILDNLAGFYDSMGDYENALPLYKRALGIREKVLGPQHPDIATTLNNLAGLYRQTGDYEKALPFYQRALETYEEVLSLQHPYVATTLNNLAGLYESMGDHEKSLPLYKRALDIRENVLGSQHPDVATTLNNLATLYANMEDYENALPLYERALDIHENILGYQPPDIAATLNNLAGIYKNMGDYEKALPLYKRAFDISENVLGPQHPDVAITLNNLAGLYDSMGDYEKTLPLYNRALEIIEKVLGPEHPSTVIIRNNLKQLTHDTEGK